MHGVQEKQYQRSGETVSWHGIIKPEREMNIGTLIREMHAYLQNQLANDPVVREHQRFLVQTKLVLCFFIWFLR